MREHPWLQVHVSEVGAPHLIDPSKLEASARRLYGDAFDALWGELAPIPDENVHVVGDRSSGSTASRLPVTRGTTSRTSTPTARSTPATRRASASRAGRFVMPPCPPPELDLEAWEQTIAEIERRAPGRLALIHFGVFDDVEEHLAALRETLAPLGERVEDGMDEQTFVAAARYDVSQIDPGARRRLRARRPVLAPLPRHRALLAQAARSGAAELTRHACASRSASETNSSADACVASSTTGGATPASSASCQRAATTHQRSPGSRPGNIHCGCGVERSFPADTENSRNSSVMTAQTAWKPGSRPSVRQ